MAALENSKESTGAVADYVMRLDLGEDPFTETFSNDYFFVEAGRRQLLEELVHLGRYMDQPIVLSGDAGSGRSTLVNAAISQLHTVMDCCRLSAENLRDPEAIISILSENLHLPVSAGSSLVEFIAALRSTAIVNNEPEPILVIVENADCLLFDCMELLLSLQQQSDGIVHLLLEGDERLLCQLNAAQLPFKQLLLESLSKDETESFLLGLLQSVGFAGETVLDEQQLASLYERTKGNIGEIVTLAPEYLSPETVIQIDGRSLPLPSTHLIVVAVLVVGIVLAYILLTESSEKRALELTVPEQPIARRSKPVALLPIEKSATVKVERDSKVDQPLIKIEKPAKKPIEQRPEEQKPLVVKTQVAEKDASQPKVEAPAVEVQVPTVDAAQIAQASPPQDSPVGDARSVVIEAPKPEVVPVAKPAPAASPKPVAQVSIPPREQRILSLPAGSYMLQLLGARNEANARSLVAKYVDKLPISYFETRLKDRPWFVVVAGPYGSRELAVAGIKQLPAELQRQKPWIRQVSSIQQDIEKNRSAL
jgi:DamX protein